MLALAARPATSADRAEALSALPPDPGRQIEYIHPRDTDPRISQFLQDHVVITYPSIPSNGKLLVFLPGTFARPVGFELFEDHAARLGYRVIGLEYVDASPGGGPSTITRICAQSPDPDCAGSLRASRWFGGQGADGDAIAPPDGIESRLVSLLKYLNHEHPTAGWAAFYSGDTPVWSRLVLAGHSQGAGMAAYAARKYPVAGVALLSGGPDGNPSTRQPAAWVEQPSATPPSHWYAMLDATEPQAQAMLAGLADLGVPGPPTPWAGAAAMGASHIATVDMDPRSGGKHESTAADLATPFDGTTPAYAPVWTFLLGGGS
jgi:pimeloyl-ACP methyl ester carboxylesterase